MTGTLSLIGTSGERKAKTAAFCKLGMKYHKCLLEMNVAQLIFDTDQGHKEQYRLEALMQYIWNRLIGTLNMLARDNMMQMNNNKCTFPLPNLNPRCHPVSNTDEAQEFRRALYDEMTGILKIAFKPKEDDDLEAVAIIYDGSDIPDDTEGRRPRNNKKRNPPKSAATTAGPTDSTDGQYVWIYFARTNILDNRFS